MKVTVLRDFEQRPAAFSWTGPIAPEVLERWQARQAGRIIPADLGTLWRTVGGGEMFESETILEPFASPAADDIDDLNMHLRSRGMPSNFLAFHVGICVSAVDQSTGEVVQLDPESLREEARSSTFDEWYRSLIRSEYAKRYGLDEHVG